MALIPCPACNVQMSSHASRCPHCGLAPTADALRAARPDVQVHADAVRALKRPALVVLAILSLLFAIELAESLSRDDTPQASTPPAAASTTAAPGYRVDSAAGNTFVVSVLNDGRVLEKDRYLDIARDLCQAGGPCHISFWLDGYRESPSGELARFRSWSPEPGHEITWRCAVFTDTPLNHCI